MKLAILVQNNGPALQREAPTSDVVEAVEPELPPRWAVPVLVHPVATSDLTVTRQTVPRWRWVDRKW